LNECRNVTRNLRVSASLHSFEVDDCQLAFVQQLSPACVVLRQRQLFVLDHRERGRIVCLAEVDPEVIEPMSIVPDSMGSLLCGPLSATRPSCMTINSPIAAAPLRSLPAGRRRR
jgi:hypothetical protein